MSASLLKTVTTPHCEFTPISRLIHRLFLSPLVLWEPPEPDSQEFPWDLEEVLEEVLEGQ